MLDKSADYRLTISNTPTVVFSIVKGIAISYEKLTLQENITAVNRAIQQLYAMKRALLFIKNTVDKPSTF